MSEGQVVKACIQLPCLWGCEIIRNNSGAVKTDKGHWIKFGKRDSGDIIAISPHGRWIEVECKFGRNELSDGQIKRQKQITSMGGVYLVARNNTKELEKHKHRVLSPTCWAFP